VSPDFSRFQNCSRRDILKAAVLLAAPAGDVIRKKIPSSGEAIPVIGIGTARRYDVPADAPNRAELKEVLRRFAEMGGKVVDTAPSYGMAEERVGELVAELGNRRSLFLATKVARGGKAEVNESFMRLRSDVLDLVAVHNLADTANNLSMLRDLKKAGRVRYVGITTSNDRQYEDFEKTLQAEKLDFIQVDYALDNRGAAERILPLAADRGAAVMTNLPFGRGRLFKAVQDKKLPEWASEFGCESWAQFFLKYVVSHPAVTCAIPGTAQVKYVADNFGAARGRLPDAETRKRMESFIGGL
jgi:aryl-alcohol dehydrogenase-like predicted oxidoreductase